MTKKKNQKKVHRYAREHLKIESDRQKLSYDHRLCSRVINPGDAVWLYNPQRRVGFCPSLQRPWESPFLFTKRISDVVYIIQRSERSKLKVVHHDRLRLYEGSDRPNWHLTDTVTADRAETEPLVDEWRKLPGTRRRNH